MMTSPRNAIATAPSRKKTPLYFHFPSECVEAQRARTVTTGSNVAAGATKDAIKVGESADVHSQKCVEFLHIMKEFSESSCDANETVQRVDSLVNQDEQLLRLFPLSRAQEEDETVQRLRRVLEQKDNEVIANAAFRDDEKEMDAQDELQRWMDLDLNDLDHHMDVFNFQHMQPLPLYEITTDEDACNKMSATQLVPPTASPFMKRGTNGYFQQKTAEATKKAIHNQPKQVSTPVTQNSVSMPVNKSPTGKKSVTAALFDDKNDNDLDYGLGMTKLPSGPPLKCTKLLQSSTTHELKVPVQSGVESKAETDDESKADEDEEGYVWGMENDDYKHDLLSSIDRAVLCDRENRFLQWDLEAAYRYQQEEHHRLRVNGLVRAELTSACVAGRVDNSSSNRMTISSNSATNGLRAIQTERLLHQNNDKVMALSPISSKSPSNVDIVEDWNSLDFGTCQNRTVSHILSSCLHKRKLQYPYKNQVQLVNFNVLGNSEPTSGQGGGLQTHRLGGSLATSLAFGGQQHHGDGSDGSAISGFVPLLATGNDNGLGRNKLSAKGEKKMPKKREERKRLMTLKMQETFADLEGTFTEQDLDVKGIGGPGASLSKMALSKLENLPLPDLLNLPQDLRELKRKIEATEHKVEGTKHRHRKGGPCPRCQVQNQLRAAKRAYHKRAVAHKKLPHLVVNAVNDEALEAANAQAAAAATLELAGSVTAALKVATGAGARKGSNASLASVSGNSYRAVFSGVANISTGMLKHVQRSTTSSVSSPSGSLCSTSSMITTGTIGSTSGSSSTSSCGGFSPPPALSGAPVQPRVRGSCAKTSPSAVPISSPSSLSVSSSSNPSSPETASPHLQHVTVSSG